MTIGRRLNKKSSNKHKRQKKRHHKLDTLNEFKMLYHIWEYNIESDDKKNKWKWRMGITS